MESRREFLRSRLETTENIFNLKIPVRPENKQIFKNLGENFSPRCDLTPDIEKLVTGDLNVCRNKNILIFYKGDGLKLNTLKVYLLMNFVVNWKNYNDYIISLVRNSMDNFNSLSYRSVSLDMVSEMRFNRNEKDEDLNKIYNVDILYLTIHESTRLFEKDFYFDVFRTLLNIRDSKGLVTIIIYIGNEASFNKHHLENNILVPIFKYDLTGDSIKTNKKKAISIKVDNGQLDEAERFD